MTDSNPETRLSLILRMRNGDDGDAWEEFVSIYQPLVLSFVQRQRLQYADAAEITQDVLSRVSQSIVRWDHTVENATFRGWLYRITRNLTIDFLRRKQREQTRMEKEELGLSQIADPSESESLEFRAEYERQLFHWAASRLKPRFKPKNWNAFWMSTVEGRSIEEVAEELNLECGAIYVARSRIMSRLSQMIQQRLDETNDSGKGTK